MRRMRESARASEMPASALGGVSARAAAPITPCGSRPTLPAARPRGEAGFTLVELMVAIGVLVVGMAGVIAIYWSAARTAREARDRTNAAIIAEGVAAELAAGTLRLPLTRSPDPNNPRYERTITARPIDPAGQHRLVEIKISWRTRGGRERGVTYRTIQYRDR